MIKSREYKVVRAECPLCRKTLDGLSEKHWWSGFKLHLRSKDHAIWIPEEFDRILKTVKPQFHTVTKTKSYVTH